MSSQSPIPLLTSRSRPRRRGQEDVVDQPHDVRHELVNEYEDLDACFRLVYASYRVAGLTAPNAHQLRLTPFHILPTTEVFATKVDRRVISTVSLIGDGLMGLPVEHIYPDEIRGLRERGLRIAEIGSLADRRESPKRFFKNFMEMMHLVTQVAKHRGYDAMVATMHPKHARLYKRVLPFEQLGEPTKCSYANDNPAVFLAVDFESWRETDFYEKYFGKMRPDSELCAKPWATATRQRFQRCLQSSEEQRLGVVTGQFAWASLTSQYSGMKAT